MLKDLTVAIGVAIVAFAATTMQSLSRDVSELANDQMVKVDQFAEVKDNVNTIARLARNIIINRSDAAFVEGEKKKIAELRARNSEILAQLDKTVTLP